MRICHVNLSRGYRGGERQTERLVRELSNRGVAQRVVVRAREPLAERFDDLPGVEVLGLQKPFVLGLSQLQGDLLHAHETKAAKVSYWRWRFGGIPYVLTRRIGKCPSASPVTKAVYRNAAACVGVARSVSDEMARYAGRDAATIYSAVSDLPVDRDHARQLRRRWKDSFVVVNVAALVDAQKGQSHLIEVARRAMTERPDMHFVLVGEGRDRADLERRAAGLSNIEFTGFVNCVGDYLASADAFVLPSHHEGIGGAALDAMRAGLPVAVSAVDGLPEFVEDEVNGRLLEPGNEQGMFAALERFADDPEYAQRLALAGQATAQGFDVHRMTDAYLSLYRSIWNEEGRVG